jgi:hypothetical protein
LEDTTIPTFQPLQQVVNGQGKSLSAAGWPKNMPAQLVEIQNSALHSHRHVTLVKDCLQTQLNNY